jgi:hypothetical protein
MTHLRADGGAGGPGVAARAVVVLEPTSHSAGLGQALLTEPGVGVKGMTFPLKAQRSFWKVDGRWNLRSKWPVTSSLPGVCKANSREGQAE